MSSIKIKSNSENLSRIIDKIKNKEDAKKMFRLGNLVQENQMYHQQIQQQLYEQQIFQQKMFLQQQYQKQYQKYLNDNPHLFLNIPFK